MVEHAYAKLNLSLDVLGRAANGYHDLRTVMQSVSFGDDVEIELTDGEWSIDPGRPYLPADEKNLALRAASLFLAGTGLGARIRVEKRVPVCAGLGGGSSDAAAVLRALNKLTGAGKTADELRAMALELGSDVPFCVQGGTFLAEGRGERLTGLPPMPDCPILICKPDFSIPTPELFAKIDARKSHLHPDTAGIEEALARGDLAGIARRMYNAFEDVLSRAQSEVDALKNELLTLGALGAVMTGTGSAVFGVFDGEAAAGVAYAALDGRCKGCWLTKPSPEISV
jgi:4-diphosphocytidyl-2-C-methyl-D-erythritol kinase